MLNVKSWPVDTFCKSDVQTAANREERAETMKRKLNDQDVPEEVQNGAKASKASFADLGLDSRILQAITTQKFSAPTPVQAKGIPLALSGRDILARAKTGSGKTLAYLLPTINTTLKAKVAATKHTSALILVPTRELATQVTAEVKKYTAFCAQDVRVENITRKEDPAVTRARLLESPDIVIATPSRAAQHVNASNLQLDGLKMLTIDEADLVLSYGYEEDLQSLAAALPSGVQTILMSATLRAETDTLQTLFSHDPAILELDDEEKDEKNLTQYIVRCAEDEKFLLFYAITKLKLVKGKMIVFVADIDRCYRIKLFLEQFGVRSCVLNSELPVNSRIHVVEEFNRGVYDIIIAADENEVVGDESRRAKRRKIEEDNEEEDGEDAADIAEGEQLNLRQAAATAADTEDLDDEKAQAAITAPPPKKQKRARKDKEYGISRGIDFQNVACVLNFDLPTSNKSYTHRIGRTARAGKSGIALSFVVPKDKYRKHKPTSIPQCEHDDEVLSKVARSQEKKGQKLEEYKFDMAKLDGFRYRLADALRAVTRIAVREARTKELRQELLKSEKLKRHFEENPEELRHLRHDTESHAARVQPHLKHVPEYLLPGGAKSGKDVGFVSLRKETNNGIRKRHEFNRSRGKGRKVVRGRSGKVDPLKTLNARGRGKK